MYNEVAAEGSDDDWENSQHTTSAGSKRSAPATSPPASKCVKAIHPATAALSGLSTSMDNFAQAIITALVAPSPSSSPESTCLSAAIQTAMELENSWLTTAEVGALVNLLCEKQAHVDSYLALEKNEDVRREWVSKRLHIL
ncbi:hypothetical protein FA13DRAFT_1784382 [Coprinellus micaceus]|uniref:Uncharacterized protein n=1 Tax=Coprinellus micaceus TaxID=71717 RepID=A0A4Y7TZS3_COPMI|nr:hypothetical protein FA13DRAFT_1784382 [Coprinellus micaceus]